MRVEGSGFRVEDLMLRVKSSFRVLGLPDDAKAGGQDGQHTVDEFHDEMEDDEDTSAPCVLGVETWFRV